MLEAKAKTMDTNVSVFLRKKVLKFFFGQSPKEIRSRKTFFSRSTKFSPFKNSAVLEPKTGQFSRS